MVGFTESAGYFAEFAEAGFKAPGCPEEAFRGIGVPFGFDDDGSKPAFPALSDPEAVELDPSHFFFACQMWLVLYCPVMVIGKSIR